jgi:hypothetical protein
MNRHTFVIQVHPDGVSTLENLSTHERIRIGDMAAVGPQVERWLAELPGAQRRDGPAANLDADRDARRG